MKTFIISLLMLTSITAYSQWREQVSGLTTELNSVSAVDDSTAWACGANGIIIRTTNYGITWTNVSGELSNSGTLNNIFAWDANLALVIEVYATQSFICRTSNGGLNWTRVDWGDRVYGKALWMTDANTAYFVGDNSYGNGNDTLLKSTNGGVNWETWAILAETEVGGMRNNLMILGNNVWLGTNGKFLMYSSNMGANWSRQTTPDSNRAIWFNNETVGFAGFKALNLTTNGGTNWSALTSPITTYIKGITGAGSVWWVVTENTTIHYSSDNGTTWKTAYTAPSGNYNHIAKARTGNAIWAVRSNGGISKLQMGTELISPINNSLLLPEQNKFVWEKSYNPSDIYNLVIATDSLFTNIIINDLNLTDTFKVVYNLTPQTYFWKVRTKRNDYWYSSSIWRFRVEIPLSGVYTIKQSGGDYSSISSAISDLESHSVGNGGVMFNVDAGITETASNIVISQSGAADKPIIFQKSGIGANPLITAGTGTGTSDGIIILDGADYVTFDGIDIRENPANLDNTTRMEWGYALLNSAQNNVIKNCNISLNKTNTQSRGIYSGNTGSNSYNKIFSNYIENCYQGINITGASNNYNYNNHIGVQGGNIIRNFGGSATTSYGIYCHYQDSLYISNNNVGGGFGTTNSLYGIYVSGGTNNNITIYNNTISDTTATITSHTYGIALDSVGANGINNTVIVKNNTVQGMTSIGNITSGALYGFYLNNTTSFNLHVDSNKFINNKWGNLFSTSTGTIYGIYVSTRYPALQSNEFITNNYLSGNNRLQSTAGSGNYEGIQISFGQTNVNIYNNTIENDTLASTGTINRFIDLNLSNSVNTNCYNNIVRNIYKKYGSSGDIYGFYMPNSGTGILNFYNNSVNNVKTEEGTSNIYGLYSTSSVTSATNIYNNTIYSFYTTLNRNIYGIYQSNGSANNIYKNKIFDLRTSAGTAHGIYINSGETNNIYNNFISDIRADSSNNNLALSGIYFAGGTNNNVYNNTIYINSQSYLTGLYTFGTAAIYSSVAPMLDLRNNILVNTSTPGTSGGYSAAFRLNSYNPATYSSLSNNNLFYAGIPGPNNLLYSDGTNFIQTIEDYKTLLSPKDNNSVSENPPFININTKPYDLHINTSIGTKTESGGTTVSAPVSISEDMDGNLRYPNPGYPDNPIAPATSSDIGADEFAGLFYLPSPDLISPSNNSLAVVLPLNLKWSKVLTAPKYRLQLASDIGFTNIIVDDSTLTDTTKEVSNLNYGATYYWKVASKTLTGYEVNSGTFKFSTLGTPLIISLYYPNQNSQNISLNVDFSWNKGVDYSSNKKLNAPPLRVTTENDEIMAVNKYWFELVNDTVNRTGLIIDSLLTDTTKSINGLLKSTDYYWRVRAKNEIGWNVFSSWWKFTTVPNIKPVPNTLADIVNLQAGRQLTQEYTFTSTGSSDPDGTIDSVQWFVNYNKVSTNATLTHPFPQGTTFVKLLVIDNEGGKDSSVATVTRSAFKTFVGGPVYAGISLVGNDNMYAIASDDDIYRMDIDGNILYTLSINGKRILSSCSIGYDSSVYIASSDYNIYGFARYGYPLWPALPLGGQATGTPTLDSITNRIYLGTSNGFLHVINRNTGLIAWSSFVGSSVRSSLVITQERKLVLFTAKGNMYGYNLATTNTNPSWYISSTDSVLSSPAVDHQGYIYIGTRGGKLKKISLPSGETGSVIWQTNLGSAVNSSPVIDALGNVYIGTQSGQFIKINGSTGAVIWTYNSNGSVNTSPCLSNTNRVYFGNTSGEIIALDTSKNEVWYYKDSSSIGNALLYSAGTLYAGTVSGRVIAIYDEPVLMDNPSTSIPQWATYMGNNRRSGVLDPYSVIKITVIPEGLYDAVNNRLHCKDTFKVYLREITSPFALIDSAVSVIDSLNFTGFFEFKNAPTGTYYIVTKHRNSLETWSKSGGMTFTKNTSMTYNFSTGQNMAYGDNMILKGTKWCIYSGDVSNIFSQYGVQDGFIDGNDNVLIFNDAENFMGGWIVTDLNGDLFIDGNDDVMCFNNAENFIGVIKPMVLASPEQQRINNKIMLKNRRSETQKTVIINKENKGSDIKSKSDNVNKKTGNNSN